LNCPPKPTATSKVIFSGPNPWGLNMALFGDRVKERWLVGMRSSGWPSFGMTGVLIKREI
jgi:hypothetical protein